MTTCTPTKGTSEVDERETSTVIVLSDFVGTIDLDSNITQLRIDAFGDCEITNDIRLAEADRVDKIKIYGTGTIKVANIEASILDVRIPLIAGSIKARCFVPIETSIKSDSTQSSSNIFIDSEVILSFVDCSISCSGYEYCFKAPFVYCNNTTLNLSANINCLDVTDSPIFYEFCSNIQESDTSIKCDAEVLDGDGNPTWFEETHNRDKYGNLVIRTRRIPVGQRPKHLLNRYEKFKYRQGYTHPDLYRTINEEEKDFEYPEIRHREYELGIDSIYSIRTTSTFIHDEETEFDETP